jgi:hypothetical protein
MTVQTHFGATAVPRDAVLAWEAKRTRVQLRKLGASTSGDLDTLRTALAAQKQRLGRTAIEQRLARQIAISDLVTRLVARASRGRRRLCQVELFVPGARADDLITWYEAKLTADDEAAFLSACPDHHLFRPITEPHGQEVWETPGGLPIACRFLFELDTTDGVRTPVDPSYPVQLTGIARIADGTAIGAIRHQFRDEPGGARALLTVEFPYLIGPIVPSAHRWHLACEFANWIEAAARA